MNYRAPLSNNKQDQKFFQWVARVVRALFTPSPNKIFLAPQFAPASSQGVIQEYPSLYQVNKDWDGTIIYVVKGSQVRGDLGDVDPDKLYVAKDYIEVYPAEEILNDLYDDSLFLGLYVQFFLEQVPQDKWKNFGIPHRVRTETITLEAYEGGQSSSALERWKDEPGIKKTSFPWWLLALVGVFALRRR